MSRHDSFLARAFGSALGLVVALPVGAQALLEEVVVTAQKREQNLQDVPVAVTAFSAQMLEQSGVKDLFDLAANAPSLQVVQAQSSTTTAFGIRGVYTSAQNFGLESSVGLYVDDVYHSRQGSMVNNMVDVASVEVLRGPQGTLFGRNTPSGAILINSVRPDFEETGFLEASAGNYDLYGASGAKSLTVIDDTLALRGTGFFMKRDGYVDIVGQDDDVINDRDRWGLRLQALYTPSDDLSVLVIGDHSEIDEKCCAGGSWKNNFVAQDLPPGSPPKYGTDTNAVAIGGTVIDQNDFFDYKVSNTYAPESSNTDEGISVHVDWQTSPFLVSSITAYREYDSYDDADIDFIDLDALRRTNDADQNQFSQELRLSDQGDRLAWVAGLYYYQQSLDATTDTIVGPDAGPLLSLPDSALPPDTGSRNVAEQDQESYAIFGQADYNLTDQWVATLGLRWTREQKDLKNIFTQDASEYPLGAPPCFCIEPGWAFWEFAPLAPRDNVNQKLDDNRLTGTAKLSWFMNDHTMFYASYGTGYKSGGMNTDRIAESLPVEFEPENSTSYEVGMKADFPEQALRVNLALHRTDTDDLQTLSFQSVGFLLKNAGTAETYGGEIDVLWEATESTSFSMGYAYNHGEYSDFKEGDCWVGTPWQTGQPDPGDNGDGTCDRSGDPLAGNPENVLAFTANQMFRFSDDILGFLYGEYIYTDSRQTAVNNDPEKEIDSYALVNLRAGLVFEQYDTTLTLWGRNVLDEHTTNVVADSVAQEGRFTGYLLDPALWGLTLRKNF
jgi:outer membrane receptor protein involved in Fe transport